MNPPIVSVICAVHNGERFLRQSVDSILGQSFSDFEFLLINDGSTDDTASILDAIAGQDARVRVVHQEKIGLTKSLNRGLELARGRFIARQDDDDLSWPTRLAQQVAYLDAHSNCIAVGARYVTIDGSDKVRGRSRVPLMSSKIKRALVTHNVIAHSVAMFRREEVLNAGGYDESCRTAQDYELWCRLAVEHDLANLKPYLLSRRKHAGRIGETRLAQQLASRNRTRRQYREAILSDQMKGDDTARLKLLVRLHNGIDGAVETVRTWLRSLFSLEKEDG